MRTTTIAPLLVLALGATVLAGQPDPKAERTSVERAIRRRADSWLRDRAQRGLACKDCEGIARIVSTCSTCDRTGVSIKKASKILWRYMRPSFREENDEVTWSREILRMSCGQWGPAPFATSSVEVTSVFVTRDVAWVYTSPRGEPWNYCADWWVKEGNGYYIVAGPNGGAETLVNHEWFVAGSFSVLRFGNEIERLNEKDANYMVTDLERERRTKAREAAERSLRERDLADIGRVMNAVRRVGGTPEAPVVNYEVVLIVGLTQVHATVFAAPGESPQALEDRIAALKVDSAAFVRGRIQSWQPSATLRSLEQIHVLGDVAKAD